MRASPKLKGWFWLAFLFAAFLLTRSRLALPQPASNRLRFAHTFTTESERGIINAAIVAFEQAHPGVTIDQMVSNSEVYNTIGWRLQFQGRNPPDVFFHWQGFKVECCIERGWAMDLTPYLSPGFLEQFVAPAVARQNGRLYFLPHSIDISNLVWYDQDLFARLHLNEPKTLEEWLDLCAQLSRNGILSLAQGNRDLWPMGNFAAELLGQSLGATKTSRLFQPAQPIDPESLSCLRTLIEMRGIGCFDRPGVLNPGAIGWLSDIDAKVMFLSGKPAQHILGSWFLADIQDARQKRELKFSVGVFPVPARAGEVDATTAVNTGFLVNPRTKNPRVAVEFIELLLSRKYQSEFAKLGNLSMRRDAPEFTHDPLAQRMLKILAATSALVPPPDTGYRPEQASVFYEMVGKLLVGKLKLEDAARYWSKEKENLARKGL